MMWMCLKRPSLKKIFENEEAIGGAGVCYLIGLIERVGGIAYKSASAADSLRKMILRRQSFLYSSLF